MEIMQPFSPNVWRSMPLPKYNYLISHPYFCNLSCLCFWWCTSE